MERLLYRLENAFIVIVSLYVFLVYSTTWIEFLFFLTLPKLLYLIPSTWKQKKTVYAVQRNLLTVLHSYSTVVMVAVFCFLFLNIVLWSILGWVIHIAIDRVIKYKEKTMPHPLFQARG
jgi:hypothetical protein